MATRTEKTEIDELKEHFAQLRDDVRGISEALGKVAKSKAADLGEQGRAATEDLRARARNVEESATDYVRSHPMQSMAIAAGLGLVVGFLSRR